MAANDAASSSGHAGKPDNMNRPARSPPLASQSKRDRKRQALVDRLSDMSQRFQQEKDATYRDQLQKIQLDTSLVQRFNPYDPRALEIISDLKKEHAQNQGSPVNADRARSLMDMAGPKLLDFMAEVEDLIEIRDVQLTQSKNEYDRKAQEYKNVHAYKVETAKREHKALTSTLRDRLINQLTQKKNRLNREKEVLEISDSNALLLNPNQFSIINPGSPGGTHGKRATRLRKDPAEDLQIYSDKKRKRNPGDDDASPAPMRRALDPNNTTPLWQSDKARAAAKQSGPLYSIDKLFTDKELSMHYNTAAVAAHQYILRNRLNGSASSPDDSDSGNGDSNENGDGDNDSMTAPMMERQVSHQTRSTRGTNAQNFIDDKILGLEGIANFELPANLDIMHNLEPPKMPPPVPQQYLKPYPRSTDQNFPVPLSQDDINSDLSIMGYLKQYDHARKPGAHLDNASGLRKVLEAVSVPYHQARFVAFTGAPRDDPESIRDNLGLPISGLREQPSPRPGVYAAQPMSRQSSLGGAAMSRTGSTRGRGGRRG